MDKKVIVIGSMNYDVCLKQERLPEEGETVEWENIRFTVETVDKNHIEWIRMELPEAVEEDIPDDEQ